MRQTPKSVSPFSNEARNAYVIEHIILVNREFFKHGTVVSSTAPATAARTAILLVLDNIEFINTHGEILEFFGSFLCGSTCASRSVTPRFAYASLATGYTVVDGGMHFLPRNVNGRKLNTGFVSSAQSNEKGKFSVNPVLTITQEAICMYYGIKLVFGHALPSGIVVRTYNTGSLVEEYTVAEAITKDMVILHNFDDFDTMKIEFTGTAEPYNRIVVNHFAFGDVTNFTMTKRDMTSSPKAIKQEVVKEIVVPCYSYQTGNPEESLVSEEVTVILISFLSLCVAVVVGITGIRRNQATDDKKEASEMTTLIVKLENINNGVNEIKSDMRNMRNDIQDLRDMGTL